MKLIITIGALVISLLAKSQTIVFSGSIKANNGKPIENASVVVTNLSTPKVSKFGFSTVAGSFKLEIPLAVPDSVFVQINAMGYKPITTKVWLTSNVPAFSFVLQEAKFELPAITVKNSGITQRKDTVAYDIQKLRTPADDVLEDVLKRLPGIEVGDDGSIKYQGKNINKYYIEGLDMLGDKYALANRNLAAKHIAQVQVLENHQPIKMLDSLVPSQRAALNIKLLPSAKNRLLGKANLGVGVPALLVDAGINAMQFATDKQYLHVYKFNNTGNDYSGELKRFNEGDFSETYTGNLIRNHLLSIPLAQAPLLNSNRVLFNNLHVLSVNQLTKLKNNATLQLQVDGTLDKNRQTATESNQIFFLNDTIVFKEQQELVQKPWQLSGRAEYTKNVKSKYLINTTVVNLFGAHNTGLLVNNNAASTQQFRNLQGGISNAFQQVTMFNKWRFTLKHFMSYSSLQQHLLVSPNANLNIWLQVADSMFIRQRVSVVTGYQRLQASFSRPLGKWNLSQQVGYSTLLQQFNPNLQKGLDTKQFENLGRDSFGIRENITQHITEFTTNLGYKTTDFSISLSGTLQALFQNKIITPRLGTFHWLPAYNAFANYVISSRWSVGATSNLNQLFDKPFQTNGSFIMNDFRNIGTANNLTGFQLMQSNSIQFNYKNIVKAAFMSFGVSSNNTQFNTIQTQQFINSLSIGDRTLFNNRMSDVDYHVSASRYFFNLRMSASIQTNYQQSKTVQATPAGIVNSTIGSLGITSKLGWLIGTVNVDYATRFKTSNIQQSDVNKIRSADWQNMFTVTKTFKGSWVTKFGLEHYNLSASGRPVQTFFFGDISVIKRQAIKKFDVSILWQNVTNTKAFVNNFAFGNTFSQNSFQLRPSQLMLQIQRSF